MADLRPATRTALQLARRILPIALTVVAGIGLSIAAYLYTEEVEQKRVEAEFNQLASGRATAIQKELNLHLATLESTKSLYATDNVGRTKFRNFTSGTLKQYKSTQAMMWIPRVSSAERAAFEASAETDSLPAFRILERRADRNYYIAQERSEYFPIYFMEVNSGYEIVLGLDAGSEPSWLTALQRARDTDQAEAVPITNGKTAASNEIIVFQPIYRIGLPRETLDQRRQNLLGFTASIYRLNELSGNALKAFKAEGVDVVMYDQSVPSAKILLYGKSLPPSDGAAPNADGMLSGLVHMTTFDVAGRKWAVAALPSPEFLLAHQVRLPWITLGIGLSFTALLAFYFFSLTTRTARVEKLVAERTAELTQAYQHLKESEAQLIQAEKMASLGQMVAGVAHEINTPLGYVRSTAEMLSERIDVVESLVGDCDELIKMLQSPAVDEAKLEQQFAIVSGEIQAVRSEGSVQETAQLLRDSVYGLNRIAEIVVSLKDFARLDRAMVAEFDINKGIEQTLLIAQNILKNKAMVRKDFGKVPKIECSPSQINQVLLNIIKNAAEAIEGTGRIEIKTWTEKDQAMIAITDSGQGIPKDVIAKIFDPFFTTKKVGEGTGLGLSICYKIVKQHGGDIKVISELGKGTRFTISLPIGAMKDLRMTA